MTCDVSRWISGDWHSCIFDPVTALTGDAIFGLFIGAALWGGLYFGGGGRSTTPTVVCILVASIAFPTLPVAYRGVAWSILVVGATAALVQGTQKYILAPATQ